jgi:hypothetical protein
MFGVTECKNVLKGGFFLTNVRKLSKMNVSLMYANKYCAMLRNGMLTAQRISLKANTHERAVNRALLRS